MRDWGKWAFAAALPLLLASCLWGPGKFTSDLSLRKDGRFVLDYRGEILLQLPNEMAGGEPPGPWADSMARCYTDGKTEAPGHNLPVTLNNDPDDRSGKVRVVRACTASEVARLKADYQKTATDRAASKRQESDNAAKMLGLPGSDDASNRRFAATMMKYQGWRSVRYVGKGKFDVDYHFSGRVDQDFVFPVMPDHDFVVPFILIRRRTDGSVMVTAPALTGASGPLGARAGRWACPTRTTGRDRVRSACLASPPMARF